MSRYHRVFHDGAGDVEPCTQACSACCYDLLLLVTNDRKIPQHVVRGWTDAERKAAGDWAARGHLAASDNPVRRGPMPECVRVALETAPRRRVDGILGPPRRQARAQEATE